MKKITRKWYFNTYICIYNVGQNLYSNQISSNRTFVVIFYYSTFHIHICYLLFWIEEKDKESWVLFNYIIYVNVLEFPLDSLFLMRFNNADTLLFAVKVLSTVPAYFLGVSAVRIDMYFADISVLFRGVASFTSATRQLSKQLVNVSTFHCTTRH